MIKVFLAEDEFVIREAIKRTIDWQQEGYELVGEAGDGETALEKLREHHADILITDIRMPFMDGLELAKNVRQELPETLVIILSGYDDFSYAKEAIRIGVTEYILKPVTGSLLLETLGKVSARLEQVRSKQKKRETYEKVYQPQHQHQLEQEKQNIYRSMTDGSLVFGAVMPRTQELGIRISADYYCVLLMRVAFKESESSRTDGRDSEQQIGLLTRQMLREIEDRNYLGGFEQDQDTLCLIIMANELQQLEERVDETVCLAGDLLRDDKEVVLRIGAGHPVDELSAVPASYRQAQVELLKN